MGLWLPPTVGREMLAARREFEADLEQQMVRAKMLKVKDVLDRWTYELRKIDPLLELVRAGEQTHGTPLKAGYYHVIRWNPGAPPSVMTVEGPDGEFCEPNSRLFDVLAQADLWDDRNARRLFGRQQKIDEAADRERTREREARREELVERVNAVTRTQVSMLPGWSQNVAGLRGRRRRTGG